MGVGGGESQTIQNALEILAKVTSARVVKSTVNAIEKYIFHLPEETMRVTMKCLQPNNMLQHFPEQNLCFYPHYI